MEGDETKISQKEFITAMRLLGLNPTESDIRDMLARHDKDGSGDLDLAEFRTLVLELYESKAIMEDDLEQAFDHYDTDGSGKLDAQELKKILCDNGDEPLSYEEAEELLTHLDTDEDGKISLQAIERLNTFITYIIEQLNDLIRLLLILSSNSTTEYVYYLYYRAIQRLNTFITYIIEQLND
ncbi:hypothetical protein ACJMK2_033241 [Sinanodonta woodiana]|uniref:EF-hand domain-containing protein n=1 Tax=Sinanodonta woodiana TaxID=1069815 RepID=A0ABD3X5Q2_SINWO